MSIEVAVALIGDFSVVVNGVSVTRGDFERRSAAELVQLLALSERHRLHRDQVIDALWPDVPLTTASNHLSKAASYARRALGDKAAIVVKDGLVSLFPMAMLRVDFHETLGVAITDEAAVDHVLDAFAGDLLPDSPYAEWTIDARQSLRLFQLNLLRHRSRWRDVLSLDPADDGAHCALMARALERGDYRGVLRRFDQLEQVLLDELGVEPSSAARELRDRAVGAEVAPTGAVTFLFTDVEGSTRLWAAGAAAMSASLVMHDQIVRTEIEERSGFIFTTAGGAFYAVFQRASDGVAAGRSAQAALANAEWPGPHLKVRMGLHIGEAERRGADYFGHVVNTTARVQSAGHGGQVLVTEAVRDASELDPSHVVDLGEHVLRDIPEPIRIFQVDEGEFASLRTSSASKTNLPSPPGRLFGREVEVLDVRLLLSEHRLVTVAGVGGAGKTRLAIDVASEEVNHWSDGVWFVDLSTVSDETQVCPAVAAGLGLELRSGDAAREIADHIQERRLLVVIDNCEHVVGAASELIEAILQAGGTSKVLATSREWLDIDGERVFQLGPLDVATPDSPAVEFFVDRTLAATSGFVADEEALLEVHEICTRLDGLPLAIQLAASRVGLLSLEQILEGLDDRFRLLSGGRRRKSRRTLEATIDWSYDLLDPDEQQVFRALGVFAGSFDLEAVAAVCDRNLADATDLVESLLAKSLVVTASLGRTRLLETIKAYAEEKLAETGESVERRQAHLVCFHDRCEGEWMPAVRDLHHISRLSPDALNLVQALQWVESTSQWELASSLLIELPWLARSLSEVVKSYVEKALEHVDDQRGRDWLNGALMEASDITADWASYIVACGALSGSPDAVSRAYGRLRFSLVMARNEPAKAVHLITGFAAAHPPELEYLARPIEEAWLAAVGAMSNDREAVRRHTERSVEDLDLSKSVSMVQFHAILALAVCDWADNGDADEIAAALEDFERAGYTKRSMAQPEVLVFFEALVQLSAEDVHVAERVVREYIAVESGLDGQVASESLVLLAELSRREGDLDRARHLVLQTGALGGSATNLASNVIAERLGVFDELRDAYSAKFADDIWRVARPRRALAAELDRRGWSDSPVVNPSSAEAV